MNHKTRFRIMAVSYISTDFVSGNRWRIWHQNRYIPITECPQTRNKQQETDNKMMSMNEINYVAVVLVRLVLEGVSALGGGVVIMTAACISLISSGDT